MIKKWMLSVAADGSWGNYNDLHIDEIDPSYADPSLWISKGCETLREAASIRDSLGLSFVVAVGIELNSSPTPLKADFTTPEELTRALGRSPPSLYLFPPDWENWRETIARSVPVDNAILGITWGQCGYYEHFDVDDMEYRHSLFVWISPTT